MFYQHYTSIIQALYKHYTTVIQEVCKRYTSIIQALFNLCLLFKIQVILIELGDTAQKMISRTYELELLYTVKFTVKLGAERDFKA